MNRTARTVTVVALSLVMASVATYLVYLAIQNRPVQQVEIAKRFAVVAAEPLPVGTRIASHHLKLVPWPAANPVAGGFSSIAEVVDRGVVSAVTTNEPLTSDNVASKEAGAGLPPRIPPGMRAISVRINDVIGVAGFVVPGTRVDVMVVIPQPSGSLARVVVSNVEVLAAGASVVTLLVSPKDAELVGLASNQGNLLLTLRNPLDSQPTASIGTRSVSLTGESQAVATPKPHQPSPTPPPADTAPTPTPAPKPYSVEVIRGAKRTEEVVR